MTTTNSWNSPYTDADGELLIGNTSSSSPKVGTITSPNSTLTVAYSDPDIDIIASGSSLQSSFLAYVSSDILNVTGDESAYDIVFDSEDFDTGGDFNTTTGEFVAPKDGIYNFTTGVSLSGFTIQQRLRAFMIHQNSSGSNIQIHQFQATGPLNLVDSANIMSFTGIASFNMSATDKVIVRVNAGVSTDPKNVDILGSALNTTYNSFFSGSKLI